MWISFFPPRKEREVGWWYKLLSSPFFIWFHHFKFRDYVGIAILFTLQINL